MEIFDTLNLKKTIDNITIGVFDGVHLGHRLIFKSLKEKNKKSAIITFKNHPLTILAPNKNLLTITQLDEKIKLINNFDIDFLIILDFTKEISQLSYIDFIKMLKKNLHFKKLIVGDDFKIGKDKLGNIESLKNIQKEFDFETKFLKRLEYKNEIISSSLIRNLIKKNNISIAEKLLDRKFNK